MVTARTIAHGVPLRPGVEFQEQDGLRIYLPQTAINSSDAKEFTSNSIYEESIVRSGAARQIFEDILSKSDFIRTFQTVADLLDVSNGQTVLELGASHCWASVLVKSDFPGAYLVTSDLVPDCVRHAIGYERALGASVDEKWAFSVRDIPFADAQFDRIFTFAAFHHFGDHGDYSCPMKEIASILKPGGKLVLLYEPTSPELFYRSAFRRVNRKRSQEGVDEDVLVVGKLHRAAAAVGLSLEPKPFPIFKYRGSVGTTLYYYLLTKLRLYRMMVCTANIIVRKH